VSLARGVPFHLHCHVVLEVVKYSISEFVKGSDGKNNFTKATIAENHIYCRDYSEEVK
jgi:hypothetical protein